MTGKIYKRRVRQTGNDKNDITGTGNGNQGFGAVSAEEGSPGKQYGI